MFIMISFFHLLGNVEVHIALILRCKKFAKSDACLLTFLCLLRVPVLAFLCFVYFTNISPSFDLFGYFPASAMFAVKMYCLLV